LTMCFAHTGLSLTMALFILFLSNSKSMNKAIVKLKTVWIKPLSNSKQYE
jgi:hypothetical protein